MLINVSNISNVCGVNDFRVNCCVLEAIMPYKDRAEDGPEDKGLEADGWMDELQMLFLNYM